MFNQNYRFIAFFCFLFLSIATIFLLKTTKEPSLLPLIGDTFGKATNQENPSFPRNYRSVQESYKNLPANLPKEGLENLPVVGTSQFTKAQLKEILDHIGKEKKVFVIDLREETHLVFEDRDGNQIPITAFAPKNLGNSGKSSVEIKADRLFYKNYILGKKEITLHKAKGGNVFINENDPVFLVGNVYTEEEIVEDLNKNQHYNVSYLLIPVTDHKSPSPQKLDDYIAFLQKVDDEPNTVLLFHCLAGRGRTGLFIVLTDIIENAKKYHLSLEDI